MKRDLASWYSPSLGKEMPIATYGDYGFALLLVPTAAADYLEYERFQLMDHIAPFIDGGKVKVFSIDSINNESWLNNEMDPYRIKLSASNNGMIMCLMKWFLLSVTVPVLTHQSLPAERHSVLCIV